MTILGAGLQPFGTSPAGIGAPVDSLTAFTPIGTPAMALPVSSIAINPVTRDYILDANGTETGMSDTQQRMYFCMATIAGTRKGFLSDGFSPPKKVTDDMQRDVDARVRTACKPCTDDGSVTIKSVAVVTERTSVYAQANWCDNKRGVEQFTRSALRR